MRLSGSLQENLITLLAYDDVAGSIVSGLVEPSLFEGDYAEIARRCLGYWKLYRTAPKDHTADLFADILEDPGNRRSRTYRTVLTSMFDMSQTINSKYVLDQISRFIRVQTLKSTILQSAEKIQQSDANVEDIESLWHDVLRSQTTQVDSGLSLEAFDAVLADMQTIKQEFTFGISVLDELSIVPYRRSSTMLIGPTGKGKSWFLVHVGKYNLLLGKKILHVSLEMSETQVLARYFQSLFSVSKRDLQMQIPVFVFDEDYDHRLPKFKRVLETIDFDSIKPSFTFASPYIRDELEHHTRSLRGRAVNLRVKSFPSKTLTVPMLESYLDTLETVYGFTPDILLVDYIGIMRTNANNHRIDLGQNFVGLRGIADRRNIALVTVQQANKHASASGKARSTDVSEDWSLINTADQSLSLSTTEAESSLGLARIFVDKARSERDKFEVLITQSLEVGQFALDSVMMRSSYADLIKGATDGKPRTRGTNLVEDEDDGYG